MERPASVKVIVDTNVPVVANGNSSQATPACVFACADRLGELFEKHTIVIDSAWAILSEYQSNLNSTGQPGVGDRFIKWVLNNRNNRERCEMVDVTARGSDGDFVEFPDDPELSTFDLSDRKFVAVAVAHPEHPIVWNAVDYKSWGMHEAVLKRYGVRVDNLCPEYIERMMEG